MDEGGEDRRRAPEKSVLHQAFRRGWPEVSSSWTVRAGTGITAGLSSVAWGGSQFVAVGAAGIYTSPDGSTWTPQSSPTADLLGHVLYGSGRFVAFDAQTSQDTLTSTNGVSWTSHHLSTFIGQGVAFGNGTFLTASLFSSTDGVTWTAPAGTPNLRVDGAVYAGPAGWVGVGRFETFFTHP